MKSLRAVTIAIVLLLLSAAFAQEKPKPEVKPATATVSNPAFEKIKSLAGDWETKTPDGKKTVQTRFQIVSAGSAVLITVPDENEGQMITVIHPDGPNSVIATHYCSAKNQPRMVAEGSSDPNKIVFKFKDVTNYNAATDPGHISGVVFDIADADHHSETWTFRSKDGKEATETFNFTRKK